MAVNLAPVLKQRFDDSNGNPLAGGKVWTYQAGTTTPQATYTDSTGVTPNANPVILDSRGEANIWLDVTLSYKFEVLDSNNVLQYTTDGVIGVLTSNSVDTNSIINGAVTNAKLANMPANTLKGNDTGVSAAPQDLTVAEVITMLALPVPDDVTTEDIAGELVVKNGSRCRAFQANGRYSSATFPQNSIDGVFLAPYNITINSVWIYNLTTGTASVTEYDLKVCTSPGGSFATVLSTTGKISATSAIAITAAGALATATLNGHGFVNGDSVTISGAALPDYNGTFVISAATTNTFQYSMGGSPGGPAVGAVINTKASNVFTDSGSIISSQAGVVKPVISAANVNAGSALRFDLITGMTGGLDAQLIIFYTQR
jgi:hypothetical protein